MWLPLLYFVHGLQVIPDQMSAHIHDSGLGFGHSGTMTIRFDSLGLRGFQQPSDMRGDNAALPTKYASRPTELKKPSTFPSQPNPTCGILRA